MATIRYSIIVPALEEEAVIGWTLDRLAIYLLSCDALEETEVIVVTADSKDNTAKIVKDRKSHFDHFQFIEPGPKVGKGRDVQAGIMAARGDYILFTDADLATPEWHIMPAFKVLEEGSDIVIGVRNLRTIHHGYRVLISLGANLLTRLMVLPSVPDTQCGFKAFTKQSAHDIFEKLTVMGWGFDIEVLVIARKLKLQLKKMPIRDWHDPKIDNGLVGESSWKASVRTLKELIQIRKNRKQGIYDKA